MNTEQKKALLETVAEILGCAFVLASFLFIYCATK